MVYLERFGQRLEISSEVKCVQRLVMLEGGVRGMLWYLSRLELLGAKGGLADTLIG